MWQKIKDGEPLLIAGVAGSLMGLFYTKPLCLPKMMCSAIGGTGAALFLSPALSSWFDLGYEGTCALSFLFGVFSMSIIGVVFQVIERLKEAPIKTLSSIVDVLIDVLLAFRHGTQPRSKIREDSQNDVD